MAWRHTTYLKQCAEAALSPRAFGEYCADLHALSGNPFEEGRAREEAKWSRGVKEEARKMIWC